MSAPGSGGGANAAITNYVEDLSGSSLNPTPLAAQTVTPDTMVTPSPDGLNIPPGGPGNQTITQFSSDQLSQQFYLLYRIETHYFTDNGLLQLPTASAEPAASELVKVCAACSRKLVRWYTLRCGAKPILPHWNTGNPNEFCASRRIVPLSCFYSPDGQEFWQCAGEYVYYLENAVQDSDRLFCGAIPVVINPSSLQVIDGSLFSQQILQAG